MTEDSPRHDPYRAFRFANYRLFATANTLAVLGSQLQLVALGWELWNRTHNMADLGWLGLMQAAPVFLFVIPSGHIADTFSRRKIIIVTQLLAVLSAVGLAVLASVRMPVTAWLPLAYSMAFFAQQRDDFFPPGTQRHPAGAVAE